MYICNAYQLLPSNSTEYAYRYRELGRALVLSYDGLSALNVFNEIATELVNALDTKLQHVFANSHAMQNEFSMSYKIAQQLTKWQKNQNLKELLANQKSTSWNPDNGLMFKIEKINSSCPTNKVWDWDFGELAEVYAKKSKDRD